MPTSVKAQLLSVLQDAGIAKLNELIEREGLGVLTRGLVKQLYDVPSFEDLTPDQIAHFAQTLEKLDFVARQVHARPTRKAG